ncbi:MAG: carbohydrate kinase family protein [Eubacteriales bacterium]|nr:carbohydrate kinase family protein [Eubacteriales bacterium]
MGMIAQDILVTNVPKLAFSGEADTVLADSLTISAGGDAANEAVILSRLGSRTALLTRLDSGNVGTMLLEEMKAEGVDTSLLIRPNDCRTMTSMVFIHPDGEHHFVVGPGKNFDLESGDFDPELLKQTRAISAASLFGFGHLDTDGMEQIFRAAQEAGVLTIADTVFDLHGIGPHGVDRVYPYVDYLLPSIGEAVYITGEKEPEAIAEYFLKAGVKHVVLKLGAGGSFFMDRREAFYTEAFPIDPVDTTGCGDNFAAAFIHSLLKGKTHRECMLFASAAGAVNALGVGAHNGVRSEEQLLEFMKKQ